MPDGIEDWAIAFRKNIELEKKMTALGYNYKYIDGIDANGKRFGYRLWKKDEIELTDEEAYKLG